MERKFTRRDFLKASAEAAAAVLVAGCAKKVDVPNIPVEFDNLDENIQHFAEDMTGWVHAQLHGEKDAFKTREACDTAIESIARELVVVPQPTILYHISDENPKDNNTRTVTLRIPLLLEDRTVLWGEVEVQVDARFTEIGQSNVYIHDNNEFLLELRGPAANPYDSRQTVRNYNSITFPIEPASTRNIALGQLNIQPVFNTFYSRRPKNLLSTDVPPGYDGRAYIPEAEGWRKIPKEVWGKTVLCGMPVELAMQLLKADSDDALFAPGLIRSGELPGKVGKSNEFLEQTSGGRWHSTAGGPLVLKPMASKERIGLCHLEFVQDGSEFYDDESWQRSTTLRDKFLQQHPEITSLLRAPFGFLAALPRDGGIRKQSISADPKEFGRATHIPLYDIRQIIHLSDQDVRAYGFDSHPAFIAVSNEFYANNIFQTLVQAGNSLLDGSLPMLRDRLPGLLRLRQLIYGK